MARRILDAVGLVGALTLVALLGVTFLDAPPARARSLPTQVLQATTVPRPTTPATSVAPPRSVTTPTAPATTVRTAPPRSTVPTTRPAPTTTPPTRPATPPPAPSYTTAQPTTTVAATTTTSTTIAPLGNSFPATPATLPLRTRGTSAHVNPVFAVLSGIGFLVALLIVSGRLLVTRSGGLDRQPLPPESD